MKIRLSLIIIVFTIILSSCAEGVSVNEPDTAKAIYEKYICSGMGMCNESINSTNLNEGLKLSGASVMGVFSDIWNGLKSVWNWIMGLFS